jgi:archaellum biogenesis ATPase FlaH
MTTVRRTDEHNLRQTISEILEQMYAIEYAMGLFYRKGSLRELERARDDVEDMREAVDRLRDIIVRADQPEDADVKVAEPAT